VLAAHRTCTSCHAVFRHGLRCPRDGHPLIAAVGDPLLGRVIGGRYQIESFIGEGGVGRVYAARHTRMSRRFAIKVPFGELAHDEKMRRRFFREADSAGRLSHRNVVGVLDVGETDEGLVYMALDLVEGRPLTATIERDAPLRRERVVSLFRQILEGVAHAHDRGLIHRDLKPDNIVVETDTAGVETVRVVDFGIAIPEDIEARGRLTTEGIVVGTPYYMAPEQATGGALDARSDLFALGLILYEMLSGVTPFSGDPVVVVRRLVRDRPPRIRERVPGLEVEPALESLAFWLLEKDPAKRPASARDVIAVLDEMQRGWKAAPVSTALPAKATVLRPAAAAEELQRRRSAQPLLAVAIVLAVVGVATWIGVRVARNGSAITALAAVQHPRLVEPVEPMPVRAVAARIDVVEAPSPRPRTTPAPEEKTQRGPARSFAARYEAVGRRLNDAARIAPTRSTTRLVERYRAINYLDAVRHAPARRAAEVILDEIDSALSLATRQMPPTDP
jgi:hypothetical protein